MEPQFVVVVVVVVVVAVVIAIAIAIAVAAPVAVPIRQIRISEELRLRPSTIIIIRLILVHYIAYRFAITVDIDMMFR